MELSGHLDEIKLRVEAVFTCFGAEASIPDLDKPEEGVR
jgi:hypothetical protein